VHKESAIDLPSKSLSKSNPAVENFIRRASLISFTTGFEAGSEHGGSRHAVNTMQERRLDNALSLDLQVSYVPEAAAASSSVAKTPAAEFASFSSALSTAATSGALTGLIQKAASDLGILSLASAVAVPSSLTGSLSYTSQAIKTVFPTSRPSGQPSAKPTLFTRYSAKQYSSYMVLVAGVCLGSGLALLALSIYVAIKCRKWRTTQQEPDADKGKEKEFKTSPKTFWGWGLSPMNKNKHLVHPNEPDDGAVQIVIPGNSSPAHGSSKSESIRTPSRTSSPVRTASAGRSKIRDYDLALEMDPMDAAAKAAGVVGLGFRQKNASSSASFSKVAPEAQDSSPNCTRPLTAEDEEVIARAARILLRGVPQTTSSRVTSQSTKKLSIRVRHRKGDNRESDSDSYSSSDNYSDSDSDSDSNSD